jgi:hypothetical protein
MTEKKIEQNKKEKNEWEKNACQPFCRAPSPRQRLLPALDCIRLDWVRLD